jgi:hypothetical protein
MPGQTAAMLRSTREVKPGMFDPERFMGYQCLWNFIFRAAE